MVGKLAKVITGAAAIGYVALGGFLTWLLNDNIDDAVDGRMAAYAEEHPEETYSDSDNEKVAIIIRICTKLYIMILMPAKLIWCGIKYSFTKYMGRC